MAYPDIIGIFGDYLATFSDITTLTSTRIHGGRNNPPAGYRLSDGECITYKSNGGTLDYSGKVVMARFQMKTYGESEKQANDLFRIVFDDIHDTHPTGEAKVYQCRLLSPEEQILEERDDVFWPFTLSFWRVEFRNC